MKDRSSRGLAVFFALLAVAAGVYGSMRDHEDAGGDAAATEAERGLRTADAQAGQAALAVAVLDEAGRIVADKQLVSARLASTFPGRQTALCGPSRAGDFGHQERANGAVFGIHGQTALVSGQAKGKLWVQGAGQWLHWEDGRCRWEDPAMAELSGAVEGGGEHVVTGCPGMAAVRTDADGRFALKAPVGTMCFLRAHPAARVGTGNALGIQVKEGGVSGLELSSLGEVEDVSTIAAGLADMSRAMLQSYRKELGRLEQLPEDQVWSSYRAHVKAQIAEQEQNLRDLSDPEQMPTLVRDFLMGETW